MKKLFAFIIVVLAFTAISNAQPSYRFFGADTLINGDTISHVVDFRGLADNRYSVSVSITADSISGSNRTATAYIQASNSPSVDDWHTVRTVTITNSGVQLKSFTTDTIAAVRFRVYFISGGTQRTNLKYGIHATRL
jgi:hypothetical protein